MKIGNVWIVSDDILSDRRLALSKNGLLITQYVEDVDLLFSSFAILKRNFENYNPNFLKKPASNCSENGLDWPDGKKIYEYVVLFI